MWAWLLEEYIAMTHETSLDTGSMSGGSMENGSLGYGIRLYLWQSEKNVLSTSPSAMALELNGFCHGRA